MCYNSRENKVFKHIIRIITDEVEIDTWAETGKRSGRVTNEEKEQKSISIRACYYNYVFDRMWE